MTQIAIFCLQVPLKGPQSCEFAEIFQNYRAEKRRLATSAVTSRQERMKESQHRPSLKTLLQGRILFLPAKLFFQPCLRDVWFMVAAITYDKELGISVHKLASSEMTSLKRRNHSDPEHGINVKTQSLSNAKTVKLFIKRTL